MEAQSTPRRIAIGCDHHGVALKQALIAFLTQAGYIVQDFGTHDPTPVDYPDVAVQVAGAVAQGKVERGILICSTGIGMSIAANKVPGVRAALCHDTFSAQRARGHNNANVLCLAGSALQPTQAQDILQAFLTTPFEGGRHARRVEKIAHLERSHIACC
ncbi:MAG: ribose 5-phosphate isomerase B [Dehalococcoidia bacterium]|nr:ribose 5-phosphate isomerase B [Dehalococcoidia bacterium]MDW8119066.1 ribose 5-phosphate isomerase B [Chloroflexota bacterium]